MRITRPFCPTCGQRKPDRSEKTKRDYSQRWHAADSLTEGLKALLTSPDLTEANRETLRGLWKAARDLRAAQ